MIDGETFKILSLQYAEQVRIFQREIRHKREELRALRMQRKLWEKKLDDLNQYELFPEDEARKVS